jgi:hypothetical protein
LVLGGGYNSEEKKKNQKGVFHLFVLKLKVAVHDLTKKV